MWFCLPGSTAPGAFFWWFCECQPVPCCSALLIGQLGFAQSRARPARVRFMQPATAWGNCRRALIPRRACPRLYGHRASAQTMQFAELVHRRLCKDRAGARAQRELASPISVSPPARPRRRPSRAASLAGCEIAHPRTVCVPSSLRLLLPPAVPAGFTIKHPSAVVSPSCLSGPAAQLSAAPSALATHKKHSFPAANPVASAGV